MTRSDSVQVLSDLSRLKTDFTPAGARQIERLLEAIGECEFSDAAALVELHEDLLFFRVYPRNRRAKLLADKLLTECRGRVRALVSAGADIEPLEEPEVSGIAGIGLSAVFSYGLVRDLVRRHGRAIDIDWQYYERSHHLGRALPRFLPLLAEDALVEATVPYREWLRAAAGRGMTSLAWLLARLSSLPSEQASEIYDSLELMLRWELGGSRATRTRARLPVGEIFYHDRPLLRRKDINLDEELSSAPLPLERLSRAEGERVLELMRDTSAVRYRELHGFTFGDPKRVVRARAGRGVEIYVVGVPPAHRLPLRAYHGGLFVKNGVPVGYVEGLSLAERMEVGFNLYYTFRDGETAWLYARTLRLFRQLAGVECFAVDPYQIGRKNEEAIDSGAFWFYRKLGFRPVRPEIAKLCIGQERKMREHPAYRTPARLLRQLAEGGLIYERGGHESGEWDRFNARSIGLRLQTVMAREHGGDPARLRKAAVAQVSKALGASPGGSEDLVLALSLVPGLASWPTGDKTLAARIVRAKMGADENGYLRLMQKHGRLRKALLELGTSD